VHRQAGVWFDDPEIYAWLGANLHRISEPSFRHYMRARELKAAGMDWTEILAPDSDNPRARLAAEILASATYPSTGDRVRAFVRQGGGCRATFFNYRRRLKD
jgi:CubicO group peptidase (beta-lactamase class C family)